jgi:hypothetical protein
MGNTNTKNIDKSKIEILIDNIATNYILTQNFKDMKNLSNEDYCNKLVLLTSNVLEKLLKKSDIDYLEQKTRYGDEVNIMNKDVIYDININELKKNMITNKVNKKRVCIGIAKYYIQVAQLFSAIVSTLNPEYIYIDKNGNKKKTNLYNKHSIPKDSSISVQRVNLCSDRINALSKNKLLENNKILLTPHICNINLNKRRFTDEFGIPELEKLYYDKYNFNTGNFDDMTEKMKIIYNNDLIFFYNVFTGKDIPKVNNVISIKKFSQIPLRAYHNSESCSEKGIYKKHFKMDLKNKLFMNYSDNIKDILNITKINQDKLINILNNLFIIKDDDIKLNKNINNLKLQDLINETREIIKKLYSDCETKFIKGIKILDSIIEKQALDTTKEQINNLIKIRLTNENEYNNSFVKDTLDKNVEKNIPNTFDKYKISEEIRQIEKLRKSNSEENVKNPISDTIKERELRERELKERDLKERELRERELRERELRDRELRERELRELIKLRKEREEREERKLRELRELQANIEKSNKINTKEEKNNLIVF